MIAVLVGAAVAILIFPDFLSQYFVLKGNRIALATLFVEAAGVVAILIAVWEFAQGQRKPKLRLWLESYGSDGWERIGGMVQEISVRTDWRGVGQYFSLLIENHGSAAARWVNVAATVRYPDEEFRFFVHKDWARGDWSQEGPSTVTFNGGDDFIVYERPKNPGDLRQWCSNIGILGLDTSIPEDADGEPVYLHIDCAVWADGFPRSDQTFPIRLEMVPEEQ